MVAVASTKTTMKSSVITFEPRQVMLEKQTVKKQKEGKDNVVLLLKSIASYLHSKGFSNTLSAFQSEAPPEIDGWKAHSIDLEDIFQKYLETSEYPVEQNVKGSKDQDSQKEEDNLDAVQPVSKKKKKKSKDSEVNIEDGNGLPKHLGDEVYVDSDKKKSKDDFEKLVTETDNGNLLVPQHGKAKEKKKKKQKLGSESFTESFQQVEPEKNQDLQEETGCADQSGKSHKKSKDKRNKNKSNSESCNLNTEQSKSGTLEEATEVIQLDDMHAKPKDKKKKKHKSVSMDSEHPDDSSLPDSKEETSVPEENTVVDEKKGSKKRKRSGSEEGQPQAGEKTVRKESKITKPEGLEENLQQKQLAKDGLDVENGDLDTGKKRKVATRDEGLKISQKPSPDEKIDGSMDVKERAGGLKNGQMEVNGHVDGLFRKEEEGIPTSKSKSKKSNNSAEPKTVNAFRRVKVEEVKFLDNRLQDNSYWAKDGADIGYGAKAQEVLGQVKGRDFRHEKTKKKRGSYRGGQIDFQAHSIKFNYSDDDQ